MATKTVTLKDSNGDTLYPVTDSNVVNINQQKTLAQALDGVVYAEDPTAAATASPWVTSSDIDWSSFASSVSGNVGYIQIGDLLVQWGRSSAYVGSGGPAESNSFTVYFDKAFASNPFATIQMEDIPGVCGEYSVVFGTSTTSFTGAIGHATAADAGTRYFRWLAVGKAA